MTEEKSKIRRAVNILGIDQILGVVTGLFLRAGHLLLNIQGLETEAILLIGKDFLLEVGQTTGPILETELLVIVQGTMDIDHHLGKEDITVQEIDRGKVLVKDLVVQHQIDMVQLALVIIDDLGAAHLGPHKWHVYGAGAHISLVVVRFIRFGKAHHAHSAIFYIRPSPTGTGVHLEIAIMAVTKIVGSCTASPTTVTVTKQVIGHS